MVSHLMLKYYSRHSFIIYIHYLSCYTFYNLFVAKISKINYDVSITKLHIPIILQDFGCLHSETTCVLKVNEIDILPNGLINCSLFLENSNKQFNYFIVFVLLKLRLNNVDIRYSIFFI